MLRPFAAEIRFECLFCLSLSARTEPIAGTGTARLSADAPRIRLVMAGHSLLPVDAANANELIREFPVAREIGTDDECGRGKCAVSFRRNSNLSPPVVVGGTVADRRNRTGRPLRQLSRQI